MNNCFVPFIIAIILFIISFIFIIMTINLDNELKKKNLIRLYNIKNNESLTKVIDIRKNDGTGCNISSIYEDGKNTETKSGSACL